MNRLLRHAAGLAIATALLPIASVGVANDVQLPPSMAWTAFGTGAGSHAQMVSLANTLNNEYGTTVRIVPADTTVARVLPLRTGQIDICGCGGSMPHIFEGMTDFAAPEWGPQPLRVILAATQDSALTLAVAGDQNAQTPSDLRGKRIAYIQGSDAMNILSEAYLAYGGLTWDDVVQVPVSGYKAAFDAILSGRADAAPTVSTSGLAQRVAASPRGLSWLSLDPENAQAWERFNDVLPAMQPHKMKIGAGLTNGEAVDSSGQPFPGLVAMASFDADTAYNLVKALTESYEDYADAVPGNEGFALGRRNLQWAVPLHEGAVRYYREIGQWTPQMQAHQERLLERESVLATAWAELKASNPPEDRDAFRAEWAQVRAKALRAAGFKPGYGD